MIKPSKYKNIKVEIDDLKFDSKAEGKRHQELSFLQRCGEIKALRCQVRYLLIPAQKNSVRSERPVYYIADFEYTTRRGVVITEDVKGGKSTPEFVIKRKLMLEKHGVSVVEIRK